MAEPRRVSHCAPPLCRVSSGVMSQRPVLPAAGQQMMPGLQTPVNKMQVEPFHYAVSVSNQRMVWLETDCEGVNDCVEGFCWIYIPPLNRV